MNISDFNFRTFTGEDYQVKPQIICNDGFKMSVQGSAGHYCEPRQVERDYYKMEIGFPSEEEPLISEFAEDKSNLTGTVYGWVPCDIIDDVIKKHGGINKELTFKTK